MLSQRSRSAAAEKFIGTAWSAIRCNHPLACLYPTRWWPCGSLRISYRLFGSKHTILVGSRFGALAKWPANFNWLRNTRFDKHVLACACCITVLLSICDIILAGILRILRMVLCSNICRRAISFFVMVSVSSPYMTFVATHA